MVGARTRLVASPDAGLGLVEVRWQRTRRAQPDQVRLSSQRLRDRHGRQLERSP